MRVPKEFNILRMRGQDLSPRMWYLATDSAPPAYDPDNAVLAGVYSFIASFVMYGYLIPISLYVSLEMVKVIQARTLPLLLKAGTA